MEKIAWKLQGMHCTNCALSVSRYLEKEGMRQVHVDFIGGEVVFETPDNKVLPKLEQGIRSLGYSVAGTDEQAFSGKKGFLHNHFRRFLFCLPFTLILMLHMLPARHNALHHWLSNPWMQLLICLPVYITGMLYFGRSTIKSLRNGMPDMNVLITLGATAAFVYSLAGTLGNLGMDFVFYETTATIITLVFLGEWIENRAVSATRKELAKLAGKQKVTANMIAFDDKHQEIILPVDNSVLKTGDLVLIKTGEQVPADCKILWGEARVDESLLTGESIPVSKTAKDLITGGSLLVDGTVKAQVTAAGADSVLSRILQLVKQAQHEKPPMQQLADKISAVFVPLVVLIAVATFFINHLGFDIAAGASLMRSIAVLVISCPCAMGLATPAAIAVGLGRAAKKGILYRDAKSLELFSKITTVVFDKTGTLTTGALSVTGYNSTIDDSNFRQIVYSLEQYSNHPIARSLVNNKDWKSGEPMRWKKVEEIKGIGVSAEDLEGNTYQLGSYKLARELTQESAHTAYLLINNKLAGWFDMDDTLRPEAVSVIKSLHEKNLRTILLTGDNLSRAEAIARQAGITEVYAEKSPTEKLAIIDDLNSKTPVVMVGDGINDAPALAKATIGISLSDAAQVAMQSAQVVLMNSGIRQLPEALGIGKHTHSTIRQNLFWAFIYNIIAIPVAACGWLNPGIAALAMGFSDVVLAINSIRLRYRKLA